MSKFIYSFTLLFSCLAPSISSAALKLKPIAQACNIHILQANPIQQVLDQLEVRKLVNDSTFLNYQRDGLTIEEVITAELRRYSFTAKQLIKGVKSNNSYKYFLLSMQGRIIRKFEASMNEGELAQLIAESGDLRFNAVESSLNLPDSPSARLVNLVDKLYESFDRPLKEAALVKKLRGELVLGDPKLRILIPAVYQLAGLGQPPSVKPIIGRDQKNRHVTLLERVNEYEFTVHQWVRHPEQFQNQEVFQNPPESMGRKEYDTINALLNIKNHFREKHIQINIVLYVPTGTLIDPKIKMVLEGLGLKIEEV